MSIACNNTHLWQFSPNNPTAMDPPLLNGWLQKAHFIQTTLRILCVGCIWINFFCTLHNFADLWKLSREFQKSNQLASNRLFLEVSHLGSTILESATALKISSGQVHKIKQASLLPLDICTSSLLVPSTWQPMVGGTPIFSSQLLSSLVTPTYWSHLTVHTRLKARDHWFKRPRMSRFTSY